MDLKTDKEIIDFLEELMTPDEGYCEIYLAGLRNFSGKANSFQFETNPNLIPTIYKQTLREVITEAMNFFNNENRGCTAEHKELCEAKECKRCRHYR